MANQPDHHFGREVGIRVQQHEGVGPGFEIPRLPFAGAGCGAARQELLIDHRALFGIDRAQVDPILGRGVKFANGIGQNHSGPAIVEIPARVAVEHLIAIATKEPVIAFAPSQRVNPCRPEQGVIALVALQTVVQGVAGQPIRAKAADQPINADKDIAHCLARVQTGIPQIDHDSRKGKAAWRKVDTGAPAARICAVDTTQSIIGQVSDQRVIAATSGQKVIATVPVQHVIARTARQVVVAKAAKDPVVARPGFHILEPGECIPCGIAAGAKGQVQVDLAIAAIGKRIAERVDPIATKQEICAPSEVSLSFPKPP